MSVPEIGSILDELRRELRRDSKFLKLTAEHQVWLVERLAAGDYGTLAQLSASLLDRSGISIGESALHAFKAQLNRRLLAVEGTKRARRDVLDKLVNGSAMAAETEALARRMLPGVTASVASLLGDHAFNLVLSGADSEELRPTLRDFLDAAKQAHDDRVEERRTTEAQTERQRVQRENVELFIRWHQDKRAQELLNQEMDNADRIQAMGRLVYGDLWNPEPAQATPALNG